LIVTENWQCAGMNDELCSETDTYNIFQLRLARYTIPESGGSTGRK
jgi:hypothetical protein